MSAEIRTSGYLAVAAAAGVLAMATSWWSGPTDVEGFSGIGQPFFPAFDDPFSVTNLEVVDFDSDAREPVAFGVKQEGDTWVIPTHHDYPAEAESRLAKTAASLIGIERDAIKSRSKDDFKKYGVVDPTSASVAEADERGTRVTLRDSSSNAVVDLIVGKPVEDRDGYFYVREPEKNTICICKMDVDLSARFRDWIEPDLLKMNQTDLVRLKVDSYSVDESRGAVIEGEILEFEKEGLETSGQWQLAGLTEEEELQRTPITDMARNLDNLEIVGVRPKPEGLRPDLTIDPAIAQSNPLAMLQIRSDMTRSGFFVAEAGNGLTRVVSNEGELIAGLDNGVRYTLYFGEVARGAGRDLEVGFAAEDDEEGGEGDDEAAADSNEAPEDNEAADDTGDEGPRRYVLIRVEFDETLLGSPPEAPVKPERPAILDAPAEPAPAEPAPGETPPAAGEEGESEAAEATDPEAAETDVEAADESTSSEATEEDDACGLTAADETGSDETSATEEAGVAEPPQEAGAAGENAEEEAAEAVATQTGDEGSAVTEGESTTADGDEAGEAEAVEEEPPMTEEQIRESAQQAYDAALGEYEAKVTAHETAVKEYEEKLKAGREAAEELAARFADWYYVISADSFESLRVTRTDVVKEKSEEDEASEAPAGFPGGLPEGLNLPGGLNLPQQ